MTSIQDILQTKGSDVWVVSPDALVFEALEILAEKDVGALPVVEHGELVGVFSERDYARKVILQGRSSRDVPVRDLMAKRIVVVPCDVSVETCMRLMTNERVRHLPVVEGDRLVGIVTIGDVVKQIIADQDSTIQHLERYIRFGR